MCRSQKINYRTLKLNGAFNLVLSQHVFVCTVWLSPSSSRVTPVRGHYQGNSLCYHVTHNIYKLIICGVCLPVYIDAFLP